MNQPGTIDSRAIDVEEAAPTEEQDWDPTLENFRAHPYVDEFIRATRRNEALSEIFEGVEGFHTTQGFTTAEELAGGFDGTLEGVNPETVALRVAQAHEQYQSLIDQSGITDESLRELFSKVWIYSRLTHPVNGLLEDVLAKLEKKPASRVFASGLAAIEAVVRQFSQPARKGENNEYIDGDKIVVIGSIYGGTYAQLMNICKKTGREFVHYPITDFVKLVQSGGQLPEGTALVYLEGSSNPTLKVSPIKLAAEAAHEAGAKLVADMTFTPLIMNAGEHGADLTLHSMTKYIGGRSEDLGGFVAGSEEDMNALMDLHRGRRMLGGGVMAPRVAREFLKNVRDLPERLVAASNNAHAIQKMAVEFGFNAKMVDDYPGYQRLRDQSMPSEVSNGMLALYLDSQEQARTFTDAMIKRGIGLGAVSLGATTTYYSIPAETTHSEMPAEEQAKVGITQGLVRVSCGTEEDLVSTVREVLMELKEDA